MSITVSGREVFVGDPLYHVGFRAWGIVQRYDTGSAVLELTGSNGQVRSLYVQQGGRVNGIRQLYWHEPIQLDLPFQNISKYQRLLDAIVAEMPS